MQIHCKCKLKFFKVCIHKLFKKNYINCLNIFCTKIRYIIEVIQQNILFNG